MTNEIQVYVPLLNEGTDVLRPTTGIVLEPGIVCLGATCDYNPDIEHWAFVPGSKMRFVKEVRGGREIMVARQRVA